MGLFRAVRNFLVQFGISNYPEKNEQWRAFGAIPDDPSFGMRFRKGFMSFAGGGVNSRTTQVFIALADSGHLGRAAWETPFGEVLPPHDVLDSISTVHGDQKPFNPNGVDQGRLRREGNSYLASDFPDLTYLERCWVEPLKQEGSDSAAASLDVMSLRSIAALPLLALLVLAAYARKALRKADRRER
ncbi:unnamed protein product [Chrysoparadoxa australica]